MMRLYLIKVQTVCKYDRNNIDLPYQIFAFRIDIAAFRYCCKRYQRGDTSGAHDLLDGVAGHGVKEKHDHGAEQERQ